MAATILTRRAMVVGSLGLLAGCADGGPEGESPTPEADNPAIGGVTQQGSLSLSSPAFDPGGEIPAEYGHSSRNVNPPLRIAGVPPETAALTLVMDDPDAVEPAGTVWLHWLVWNIPPSTAAIPADWDASGAVEGTNDFGETGYGGPDPPDRVHTYRFKLFAIETELDLPNTADKRAVGRAMIDRIVGRTQLTGTFAP